MRYTLTFLTLGRSGSTSMSSCVARRTSSTLVRPPRTLRAPSSRKPSMPCSIAALGRDAELFEIDGRGLVLLFAMRAEHANEPLREDADDRRTQEERLDAHVDHAREGAGRIVGVDRGEHEVTGERCVDRDLDGL